MGERDSPLKFISMHLRMVFLCLVNEMNVRIQRKVKLNGVKTRDICIKLNLISPLFIAFLDAEIA